MATADLWQWGGPTIIVSSDGQEWTLVAQSQFPWLHSVIYGGGLFVAGGDSGAILTSTNGLDWTAQTSGNTSSLLAVAYNPQYYLSGGPPYLAVGADGVNLTSSDGTAWTVRTNFTSETLRAVAANNGELLVAGDNDAVFVGNGYNWTPVNVASWIGPSDPSSFPRSYRAAISIGNISVLGGRLYNSFTQSSFALYSSGTGWTESFPGSMPDPVGPQIAGLAYGGLFVGVGPTWALDGLYPGDVLVSTNGIDWVVQYRSENIMYSTCRGGDGRPYVAVGAAGAVITSTNGLVWSPAVAHTMTSLQAIAASDSLCLAVGAPERPRDFFGFSDPSAFATRDGVNWKATFTNDYGLGIEDMTQSRGLFVGVRGNARNQPNNDVLTTRDGVQWDIISLTNAPPLHGVTSDNDRFIVVGERGAIWVSTDGSFWSNRSVALQRGDEGFNTVTSGNGFYVAAGNVIALSTNGWDWSLQTGPLPTTVSRMLFADGIFVAASPGTTSLGPRILTSTNGLEWTVRYVRPGPSYSAPVGNIAHGNGTFLAWCGSCLRSTDGIEWQSVDSPLLAAFSGIYADQPPALEFFHGRFLIAGPFGQILQSDDTFVPALNPRSSAVGFRFSFSPKAGDSYRIQNSLNLSDWRTVDESLGDGGTNEFIDMSEATMPHRFFRVVSP